MAILKTGSRKIVVDGCTYRWRVRNRLPYRQSISDQPLVLLAVEKLDGRGSKLVVLLPQFHPQSLIFMHRSSIPGCPKPPLVPVLPSQVEACIWEGLKAGWQPAKPGKTFVVDKRPSA